MKSDSGDGRGFSRESGALHGAHLRTLEAVFRHPPAHSLEWRDVVSLIERVGAVYRTGDNGFRFDVGGERLVTRKPHTKDLSTPDVVDLRHFLQRAGWSPEAPPWAEGHAEPNSPVLLVAIDHHGARIFRVDRASTAASTREISPYDPHHFLHHLTHKGQSRQEGQRAPEDAGFYKAIAETLAAASTIVIVGHGTGTSNAAQHLAEYLRTHRRETYQRVVCEIEADLSAATPPQLLALVEQALGSDASS